jgi:predicted dithiol-disulfide oxidoreductase (DUF899 family)
MRTAILNLAFLAAILLPASVQAKGEPPCTDCKVRSPDKVSAARHALEKHNRCPGCSKQLKTLAGAKAHMAAKKHSLPADCPDCAELLKSRELMLDHGMAKHFRCPDPACRQKVKTASGLKQHMKARPCKKGPVGPQACKPCKAKNLSFYAYKVHARDKHNVCPQCSKATKSASGLKQHMKAKKHLLRAFVVCRDCKTRQPALRAKGHAKSKHNRCPQCRKQLKSADGVKAHMKAKGHK